MAEKKKDAERKPAAPEAQETPRKRRRHGYRGYPLTKTEGGVHWGRGLAGTEPLGGGGITLPKAGVFTEESTKRTKE